MYDIMCRVNENVLPDAGTSEQDLASKFCNLFVDKITNIRDRFCNNRRFVVEKEGEPGMKNSMRYQSLTCKRLIGESEATICRTDPIPSKLIKKFKIHFIPIISTLINLSPRSVTFAKNWR